MHSTIIFSGSQVPDFAGNLRTQKRKKTWTKEANTMGEMLQYNSWGSTGSGVNFFFAFFPLHGGRQLSSLPQSSAIIPHPIIQSRRCFCCCVPTYNMLGGTVICWTLLCRRQRLIHWSRCCRSAEWDTFNDFPPNEPNIVFPRLLFCRPHCPAYLLLLSSATDPIISHLFCCPCRLNSLPYICFPASHNQYYNHSPASSYQTVFIEVVEFLWPSPPKMGPRTRQGGGRLLCLFQEKLCFPLGRHVISNTGTGVWGGLLGQGDNPRRVQRTRAWRNRPHFLRSLSSRTWMALLAPTQMTRFLLSPMQRPFFVFLPLSPHHIYSSHHPSSVSAPSW